MAREQIDLARVDDDEDVRPEVRCTKDGKFYQVHAPDAVLFKKIKALQQMPEGMEQNLAAYEIGYLLLPDAPPSEVDKLRPKRLLTLIELACQPADAMAKYVELRVDARNPNGKGDETVGQPSSPTTGSATSATESPTPRDNPSEPSSASPSP